jgi:hypothetical protein
MRTVKTLSEATRLAAQSGATMEIGGRVVNAAGTKSDVVKAEPKPEPPPAPPAPDPQDKIVDLVQLQTRLAATQGEAMSNMIAEVLRELQKPAAPPGASKPMPLAFDVIRDDKGLISRIVPVYSSGLLN